ncbi:MAG: DNA-directed RNA polymerase subunit K/omega [Granulosicoccus sp.]|jgi:DNA-directed RNA polymerase subunit K/omega
MDYKNTDAAHNTITRNLSLLEEETDNVFETVAILGKRANQIGTEIKEELNSKLAEFATTTDNLEEIFENREQIEISKFYERLPKPSALAIQEMLEGKVYHRNPLLDVEEGSEAKPEA